MTADEGARAIGLLISQASNALSAGRYAEARSAASRAAEAAERLDDPVLLVRALHFEGDALRLLGDYAGALARFTRALGLAEDPTARGRLDHPDAVQAVAIAHWGWVASAQYLTGIPVQKLFDALDAADRWLDAAGHRDWRAAVLLLRASIHSQLDEHEAAISRAREALTIKLQHPEAPGFRLGDHRRHLGGILREAGQASEAAPYYRAVLDDPANHPFSRCAAHIGLAACALAAGDPATARREAERAVQLAEPLSDTALCGALKQLAQTCRDQGDLDAAWHAAERHLEAAARIGDHYHHYDATRNAAEIALDRADHATARRLLDDLDQHASAIDTATGTTTHTATAARLRQRLSG